MVGNCACRFAAAEPDQRANAIARELRQSGFTVELQTDASREAMQKAITAFCVQLAKQKAVGLFYFAGRGLQLDWRNYLVPVDARLVSAADVTRSTVDLSSLFGGLSRAGNPMNIVVLDACRDNPFGSDHKTGRGSARWMRWPVPSSPADGPGNVAADGSGKHGLYTENILREMRAPDAKIEDVFKRVRLSVRRSWRDNRFHGRAPLSRRISSPPANLRKRSEEELLKLFEDEQKL